MTDRLLAAGENVPLTNRTVRVRLDRPAAVHLVQLTGDDHIVGAAGAADRDAAEPAGLIAMGSDFTVTPGQLSAPVDRCLVVASGPRVPGVTVSVRDGDADLRFTAPWSGGPAAVVLLEFYRRAGRWRIRALGHGHAGGLPALGMAHGMDAAAAARLAPGTAPPFAVAPAPTGSRPAPAAASPAAQPEPAGATQPRRVEHLHRQLLGIWEDAARSNLAHLEAVRFADERHDRELERLVGDRAGRNPGHPGRASADRRRDEVVSAATQRRLSDLDQLGDELGRLEPTLPAALARWDSPAWRAPLPDAGSPLIRIGEVTRNDSLALRIPLLHPMLVPGGLFLVTPGVSDPAAAGGLLHRIFAGTPAGRGVRLVAEPDQLGGAAGWGLPAPTGSRPDQLRRLAERIDLWSMAAEAGLADPTGTAGPLPGVVVLPWPTLGFSDGELADVQQIAVQGAEFGTATVFCGEPAGTSVSDLAVPPRLLPTVPAQATDPWTGQQWQLAPDRGPHDADLERRLRRRLGAMT